jgi:nucleoside-diphosphate-sugar epimerase
MRVLVTGASGMVGRNLLSYMQQKGVDAIPTDLAGWEVSGNLLDREFVFGKLASLNFDAIIHMAAITEIRKTVEDPKLCFEVNCVGSLNILELALRKKVSRILCTCHDALTRVFTSNGLKWYHELEVGDEVLTLSPNGIIEPKPIERVHVYEYDGELIHFLGKRIDMLVTPNHRMLIRVWRKNNGVGHWQDLFEEAEKVATRARCRLSTGRWLGTNPEWFDSELGIRSMLDLFYLTGLYIGDGYLNRTQYQMVETGLSRSQVLNVRDTSGRFVAKSRDPVRKGYFYPRVFFAIPRADKARKKLEQTLARNGVKWSGYNKTVYVNSTFLYRFFEQCSDSVSGKRPVYTKRVPRWMLSAAPEFLEALLQGILDSDGARGKVLSTVSTQLLADVMELCAKLGAFTVCYPRETASVIEGRAIRSKSFQVSISRRKGTPMFGRSYRNIRREYYRGNVFCVEVANHNFLVERNGKIGFSGNSSANVYGAPKKNPVTEESPFDPRVPYDYSKVVMENMAMSFFKSKGLPVALTRSWLLFGEYDQPTRATIRFIRACLKDEPLTLFNGGKDTTAPTHAVNFAKLALTILKDDSSVGRAYNFGGERPVTIRKLAETIKALTGSKSQLNLAPPRTQLEAEPQISYPSLARVKSELGYKHELTLEQGLRRTIEWVRKQN